MLFCYLFLTINDYQNFQWIIFGLTLLSLLFLIDIKLDEESFITGFFHITLLTSIAYLANNFSEILSNFYSGNYLERVSFDNSAFTLVAYSAISLYVISLIKLITANKIELFTIIGLFISIIIIVLSGTRSVYGGLIVSSFFIMIYLTKNKKDLLNWFYKFLISLFILFICLSSFEFFRESVMMRLDKTITGIENLFGYGTTIDPSALGRVYQREHALNIFENAPWFGNGIKHFWVDFPLLQIFSDLGIVVGLPYVYITLILPIIITLKYKREKGLLLGLFIALYLSNMPRLFLHGQPYDWTTYIFISTLFFFYYRNKSKI
ncbi:MAG: O-antigen ligase family protein [Pseudomonadota bacterium]|nr:O-antigen ligase family protein [Pseudomonadota bacterium]